MTPNAPITLSFPGSSAPDHETTWAEFVAGNDDTATLAEIETQIAQHGYAEIGGGASPRTWIFAGEA